MTVNDEVKFKQLSSILVKGTGRELTEKEARYIKWLCSWDMETYEVFKGLFEEMKGK